MKSFLLTFLLALSATASEFRPLFNGKDLSGWVNVNCAPSTWQLKDGILVCSGLPTGVLRTTNQYRNFILEVEWKHLFTNGNAGVFLHSEAIPVRGQPFTKSIEFQVINADAPSGHATRHGDVFAIQGATFVPDRPHPGGWMRCLPSEKRAKPTGEWNHYRMTSIDGVVKLEVNGKEVSGGSNCVPSSGYICLESEGSETHFRNVRIKELEPQIVRPPDPSTNYMSIYNGIDLSGWTSESGAWTPKDWILSSTGDGLLLHTNRVGDFRLIIDWRPKAAGGSAALVDGKQTELFPLPSVKVGEWSRSHIAIEKGKLLLEGKEVKSAPAQNRQLGLRTKGDVEFANIYLWPIK